MTSFHGMKRRLLERALRILDPLIAIPLVPSALLMKLARRVSLHRIPVCRSLLRRVGVMPIRNHYYEPWVTPDTLSDSLDVARRLPGIDWNVDEQVSLLQQCTFASELLALEDPLDGQPSFHFGNGMFEQGDSEMLYNLVRIRKPKRIIEIGAGNSTLVVERALAAIKRDHPEFTCDHVCIEPFENDWLDAIQVQVLRERVEHVDDSLFTSLTKGDLLFVDSSHVIRPQGDVLHIYLTLLPQIAPGVLVHVHDIYSPRDYPASWVLARHRFWNEQYLLEGILSGTSDWKIVAAINFLHHKHPEALARACPHLRPMHSPGSFYIEKVERPRVINS